MVWERLRMVRCLNRITRATSRITPCPSAGSPGFLSQITPCPSAGSPGPLSRITPVPQPHHPMSLSRITPCPSAGSPRVPQPDHPVSLSRITPAPAGSPRVPQPNHPLSSVGSPRVPQPNHPGPSRISSARHHRSGRLRILLPKPPLRDRAIYISARQVELTRRLLTSSCILRIGLMFSILREPARSGTLLGTCFYSS